MKQLILLFAILFSGSLLGQSCEYCQGETPVTLTASCSGGTGSISYVWTLPDNSTQTGASITATQSGTYTWVCSDSSTPACTDTGTYDVTIHPLIVLTCSATDANCMMADGSASSNASGGGGGFTYSWSNGATTPNINNIPSGTYTLVVTDINGCTATCEVVVNDIGGPTCSIASFNDATCGQSNGDATVSATGGTPAYTYLWSDGQTTANATNLAAGTYTVTVTDSNNCESVCSVTIGDTPPVTGSATCN